MKPKSVHVGVDATTWSNDRGFGRFTRELFKALLAREAGFRYTLLFDHPPDGSLPPGAEVLLASTSRSLNESAVGTNSRSLSDLWKLGRTAVRAKFDVFFFPAVYSYFPILTRTPCVVCYHDTTAERLPELLFPTRLNHRLWQIKTAMARFQTTRAMTVSESSARDLRKFLHIPADRIDVVTEAADPVFRVLSDPAAVATARSNQGIPEGATLLVYVGGMNPHKNLMGLLKAMPTVIARRSDVHLVIVGDTSGKGFWDDVPGLKTFVRDTHPLTHHVHFAGYLSDPDLVDLLNGASALVFPSLWEGFGLPAVEAMSCGVPVLASRRGSLPEVIGEAGSFFEPDVPDRIADCILEFVTTPDRHARLRESALTRARIFTWERGAELAENSFRNCVRDSTKNR